jgi:hypothetical protein
MFFIDKKMSLYSAKISEIANIATPVNEQKLKRKRSKKLKEVTVTTPPPEEEIKNEEEEVNEEKNEENVEVKEEEIEEKAPDIPVEKVSKKKRVNRKPEEPPKWFLKFHENIEREKSTTKRDRKPIKHIKEESKQVAQDSWQKPQVRERVNNEVNNHLSSMYQMIFAGRKM